MERVQLISELKLIERLFRSSDGVSNRQGFDRLADLVDGLEKASASVTPVMRSLPTKDEIHKAIKRIGKESTAPDKDTPLWLETDIRAGMRWMFEKITGLPFVGNDV